MKSKKIFLLLFFVLISILYSVSVKAVEVTISDGLSNITLKKKIELRLSQILTEINTAHEQGRNPNYASLHLPVDVETTISALWDNSPFFCIDDEALIVYVLAASSPTHPVPASAYHNGWARGGDIKTSAAPYGLPLELKHNGAEELGGPLFWAHYSYIGLDPRKIKDRYADYWNVVRNHALSDYRYCVENPKKYKGYGENCWGLTASYSVKGYAAHCPGENDLGVITPTAALSSFPYTPEESMRALKYFYSKGDSIWGTYGFYDAFSETDNWTVPHYLAIDQCTIAPMIENYRSGLLWNLFMSCPEIQAGLKNLGFEVKK